MQSKDFREFMTALGPRVGSGRFFTPLVLAVFLLRSFGDLESWSDLWRFFAAAAGVEVLILGAIYGFDAIGERRRRQARRELKQEPE